MHTRYDDVFVSTDIPRLVGVETRTLCVQPSNLSVDNKPAKTCKNGQCGGDGYNYIYIIAHVHHQFASDCLWKFEFRNRDLPFCTSSLLPLFKFRLSSVIKRFYFKSGAYTWHPFTKERRLCGLFWYLPLLLTIYIYFFFWLIFFRYYFWLAFEPNGIKYKKNFYALLYVIWFDFRFHDSILMEILSIQFILSLTDNQ